MTFRDGPIYGFVVAVTVAAIAGSIVSYGAMEKAQYLLLAVGTIAIGIPHGATDNAIYLRLVDRPRRFGFYVTYIAVAAVYGFLWIVAPKISLILFLIISIYHFGQSNLFYTAGPDTMLWKRLGYLGWGAFSVFTPILYRYEEARPIVVTLIGYDPISVEVAHDVAPFVGALLLGLNVATLAILRRFGSIGREDLVKELFSFVLLYVLYATAPLYVSFIVYWAFWHSLNSVIEITRIWNTDDFLHRVARFFRSAAPLTIVTFGGIAAIFWIVGAYGSRDILIATFFVIIAAITLPHTVIMERLYRSTPPRS